MPISRKYRVLAFASLMAATPIAAAETPVLLAKAFSAPAAPTLASYEFLQENGGENPVRIRGRFDASKPKGQRITILEAVGKDADPAKIRKRMEENSDGDIWCDSLADGAAGPVTELAAPAPGVRAYSFQPKPKPKPTDRNDSRKLYEQFVAKVVIDEASARIVSFSAHLIKPWKPVIVAKMEKIEMNAVCSPGPGGRPFVAQLQMHAVGSAMGKAFDATSLRTISSVTF